MDRRRGPVFAPTRELRTERADPNLLQLCANSIEGLGTGQAEQGSQGRKSIVAHHPE